MVRLRQGLSSLDTSRLKFYVHCDRLPDNSQQKVMFNNKVLFFGKGIYLREFLRKFYLLIF